MTITRYGTRTESGLAMVAVLLVLMALFVLSAPFLVTVRNADQASSESADRSVLRVTLDSAARHAAAGLAGSHPALDETPYFDDLAELEIASRFPESFLATGDPSQAMWDVDAEDVAARVDLSSASPHVLANLIGGAARLAAACKDDDATLEVSGTEGFLPEGVVFVDDEVIGYAELAPTQLGRLTRGLLVESVEGKADGGEDGVLCGPTPPRAHEVGAFVLDQRAWALCEWRIATGKLRAYEGIEQVREAKDFALGPELGREAYLALERTTSTFGHVRAGARWQRAARVLADPDGAPEYGCKLPVDDLRWFNPGTTVRITDGTATEYGLVRKTEDGAIVLSEPLRRPFKAPRTIVAPLARTPVNVNTAAPEVLAALWTNLKLRDKSARITKAEAEQLVDLVLVSRPFTGFEDFLRRVVLPAGGLDELPKDAPLRPEALEELARQSKLDEQGAKSLVGFIDGDDALALYKNALNANDNELAFSTMPLCFTSRDVYGLDLRAAINAPSGVERARGVRELCELIVPQRDLMTVWTRQEDFDDAPRLAREAAGWMSGPVPTSRPDPRYGEVASMRWPTRARAHLGPWDTSVVPDPEATTRVYCFASREDEDGWAQLAPHREEDQARQASYALHFDDETETLEGRFLPDATAPLDLAKLGWSGSPATTAGGATTGASLMSGMAFSMWVRPRALEEGARLLDVGGPFKDADRLSLLFEGGDLVLRVLDGAGDHPDSTFAEVSEVRYPLAEGPGMPADTWSHVQIAVDGNRPDQMALWVDGRRSDETPGLTRLTAGVTGESDTLAVESTDGFPDKCVLRLGDELIEAIKKGPKSFSAKYESMGENAGYGGRVAREVFQGAEPEVNQGLFKQIDHPVGTTVQLYGYSLPVFSNVSNAASNLSNDLGHFAVARIAGVVIDGSEKTQTSMEPITEQNSITSAGWGFDGKGDDLEGLLLEPADPGRSIEDTMAAFSPDGGYAAILGPYWTVNSSSQRAKDVNGHLIGGLEVVRYSGWDDGTLKLSARGGAGLKRIAGNPEAEDVKAQIVYYGFPSVYNPDPTWSGHNDQLSYQVFVIPISVPARATSAAGGFDPGNNGSEFIQITHTGAESHLNEWVRYDEISTDGFFVRDDPYALERARIAAHAGRITEETPDDPRPPPPGGRMGMSAAAAPAALAPTVPVAALSAPPAAQRQQGGNSYWFHAMGEAEDEDFPVARAVNSWFQFRGVLGTYAHEHPRGTLVLPVFRTRNLDETCGRPGRFDNVLFMPEDPAEPGFPAAVHHAHRPLDVPTYSWMDGGGSLTAAPVKQVVAVAQSGFAVGLTHVALADRLAVPFAPSPIGNAQAPVDNRLLARMALFPSGELPRQVQEGQLGGDVHGSGAVPSAIVDEALFFPLQFGVVSNMPGQLVLANALGESDGSFTAVKDVLRTTHGDIALKTNVLAGLPEHGGLLRIGDELLCYDSFDANGFTFTLPAGGRGLLGTEPQPHRATEGVTFVGSLPLGVLGANVGAEDALLPLLEVPPGFPSQGTVRIEDELVHFARHQNGVLEMPRTSTEPGEMDAQGAGLFRGRYGTERAAHSAGTPVILFPFRYWDRWSDLADAPELTYYELACDQPDAYWKRVFWKEGPSSAAGPELGVLERTNQETPWDAAPADTNGLRFLREGKLDGDGNSIGVQSDRVEWRVFVRHKPGSFDPTAGLAHGWKTTPRLELFGVEYMGPSRTLARADR